MTIHEIAHKIARLARERRIPLRDYLSVHDKVRNGDITRAQLLKGLRAAFDREWGGELEPSPAELSELAAAFAHPRDADKVRWRDLCGALEQLSTSRPSNGHAHTGSPALFSSPSAAAGSPDDMARWRRTASPADGPRSTPRSAGLSRTGRLAGLAGGATLAETDAEVGHELEREMSELRAILARCGAALAEGAEALGALRELAGGIGAVDAAHADRRASALQRLLVLSGGHQPRERAADGYLRALLAEADAASAARTELQAYALRARGADAEIRQRAHDVEVSRAQAAHALAVEEQVLALGGPAAPGGGRPDGSGGGGESTSDGVARLLGSQPPQPDRRLADLLSDLSAACAAARSLCAALRASSELAMRAGGEAERAAESAIEAKADGTAALTRQLRESIGAHEREIEAVRESMAALENQRRALPEPTALAEERLRLHASRARTPGADAVAKALHAELRQLRAADEELRAALGRDGERERDLCAFVAKLKEELAVRERALHSELRALGLSPNRRGGAGSSSSPRRGLSSALLEGDGGGGMRAASRAPSALGSEATSPAVPRHLSWEAGGANGRESQPALRASAALDAAQHTAGGAADPPPPRAEEGTHAPRAGAQAFAPEETAKLVERMAALARGARLDMRDELRRLDTRRQGTIGAQRFDTALLAAFPTLGLSEAQLASLRQPFSTADGLVKWRPFADTFVEVTRP